MDKLANEVEHVAQRVLRDLAFIVAARHHGEDGVSRSVMYTQLLDEIDKMDIEEYGSFVEVLKEFVKGRLV